MWGILFGSENAEVKTGCGAERIEQAQSRPIPNGRLAQRTFKIPRGIRKPKRPARAHEILTGKSPKGEVTVMISAAFRNVEKAKASYMLVCVNSKRSNARSDSKTRTLCRAWW